MYYYYQAIDIDDTDTSLWSRIGSLNVKLKKFADARMAFQQVLACTLIEHYTYSNKN